MVDFISSASLLKILRDARARRKETTRLPFLAFADPQYPETCASKREEMEIIPSNKIHAKGYLELMAVKDCFSQKNELPQTEVDAKAIAGILGVADKSDSMQLRGEALRPNVLRLSNEGRLADYR